MSQFLTDKQKVIGGLALTLFSFIAASYLLHRHWLARRVLVQNPVREAPLNARLERIVQERLPRTEEEREEALDSPTPFANLSIDVMDEIFGQLEYDPNLELVSRQWRAVLQERSYRRLFQSYQDNPHLSALCTPIQAQHLTDKEKVQALYQAVIDLTLRTEGGEVKKQGTANLYSHTLSTERLSHLVCWSQAVNLTKVFTTIASSLPAAQTFLDEIREKDLIDQAEDIRQWMNNHPNDLATIDRLNLESAHLSELPQEIERLTQLETLSLKDSHLTALPAWIEQLTQLERLYLDNNQIAILPTEIRHLTRLKTLSLNNNQLIALPTEIGHLTQLEWLNLNNNQLTALPTEIGYLTQLKTLYLNNNQLTALPAAVRYLTQLEWLNLNNNQLTALPTEIGYLTQLKWLYLNNNQLTALPAAIGQLTQLHLICLDNNQLTTLPIEIGQLTRLGWLYLNNNPLAALPVELRQLRQLRVFHDQNSFFSSIANIFTDFASRMAFWR